jgi:hypothetical protein
MEPKGYIQNIKKDGNGRLHKNMKIRYLDREGPNRKEKASLKKTNVY